MKIILNALQYTNKPSGIGILIKNLFPLIVQKFNGEAEIILPKDADENVFGKATIKKLGYRSNQKILRTIYQLFCLGIKECKDSILITVDSKIPIIIPKSCKIVPIITDLGIYRFPKTYKLSRRILWKMQYGILLSRAYRYIAISEFTKKEMIELLKIPAEKIDVIYCDANEQMKKITDKFELDSIRQKYNLPDKYILFVGNFNPRKNLDKILVAFDEVKSKYKIPHSLVIVGEKGWKFSKKQVIKKLKNIEDILFLGYVSDFDTARIYSMTDLLIFTTLYEGFGIPIIEAQRCGATVLTSEGGCFKEVGGEGAAYVTPNDAEKIAEAIKECVMNPNKNEMIKKGYENAKRFSWSKSAEEIVSKLIAME